MSIPLGTRVVPFSALFDPAHDYLDPEFERTVNAFVSEFMPSAPLALLDTTSDFAAERWEISPPAFHTPVRIAFPGRAETRTVWAVQNNSVSQPTFLESRLRYAQGLELGEDLEVHAESNNAVRMFLWFDQNDAEEAARLADTAYEADSGHERRLAFPWAFGRFYLPGDSLTDKDLLAEQFVVAQYTGGQGRLSEDEQFRVVGIDRGDARRMLARLCVRVHERWVRPLRTSAGDVYVTLDERTPLEQLASAFE